jgi:hypothetical protein
MRQSKPLRWIEEAEAREVLVMAVSEQSVLLSPQPSPAGPPWMIRLRSRLFGAAGDKPAPSRPPPRC